MRYREARDDDWKLFEVVRREKRPCSDQYAKNANDTELQHILSQIALVRVAGCPAPPDKIPANTERVGKYAVLGEPEFAIYVLKAKPSRWRLYFIVANAAQKQIVFLHAVSKKRDRRDPKDVDRSKRIIRDLLRGDYSAKPLEVPTR